MLKEKDKLRLFYRPLEVPCIGEIPGDVADRWVKILVVSRVFLRIKLQKTHETGCYMVQQTCLVVARRVLGSTNIFFEVCRRQSVSTGRSNAFTYSDLGARKKDFRRAPVCAQRSGHVWGTFECPQNDLRSTGKLSWVKRGVWAGGSRTRNGGKSWSGAGKY